MKLVLLVGTLAIAATLCAQSPKPGEAQATLRTDPNEPILSPTNLQAELIRGLDVRKAKPGDPVLARCGQDLKFRQEILIPRNAKLIGHVVQVQKKGHGNPESILAIAFDKAIMRDGRELPLIASVQALAPPASMAAETAETDLRIRNNPTARPQSSRLFPGALTAIAPQGFASTGASLPASPGGVLNLHGLQLESKSPSSIGVSVIHSSSDNLRLESGTRLILRVSLL